MPQTLPLGLGADRLCLLIQHQALGMEGGQRDRLVGKKVTERGSSSVSKVVTIVFFRLSFGDLSSNISTMIGSLSKPTMLDSYSSGCVSRTSHALVDSIWSEDSHPASRSGKAGKAT